MRKRKDEQSKKVRLVTFRATSEELRKIRKMAFQHEMTMSDFIRSRIGLPTERNDYELEEQQEKQTV